MPGILSRRLIPWFLLVALCWVAVAQSQQSQTHASAGAATAGKKAFVANCSGCHGLDAHGGDRAPAIASGSDAARLSDAELMRIISKGISGAGMPAFGSLGSAQITSIIGYLRNLQGTGKTARMPGDPQRGSALFFGKAQCAECHTVKGKGGFIASDLTGYGSGRTPADIHQALVSPQKDPDDKVRQATVLTRSGQKYSGVVRAEDNFSLVLQTASGEFVSLQKSDLASLSFDPSGLMPENYGTTLTSNELNDLVSYLMSVQPQLDPAAAKKPQKRHWEDEN